MNPFIELILTVINLANIALFVWIIVGLFIHFNIVNRHHPIVYKIDEVLSRLFTPLLNPIRKILPTISGIDLSPLVLILALNFIKGAIVYYSF